MEHNMNCSKQLRKLAKSNKYQMIYENAKELSSIKMFHNSEDLSQLQLTFLYWLSVYNSLNVDLACKKPNISQAVIDDELRAEAYLLWRKENRNKTKKETEKQVNNTGVPSVVFTKNPRKNK